MTAKLTAWLARSRSMLLADDLDQHPLFAPPVELPVEDLLPGAEVELPGGHRDHHFAAHHLALDMGVSVVFSGSVVMVSIYGLVRRQALEPDFVIVMQSALVVVYEDRSLMWRCKLCGAERSTDRSKRFTSYLGAT